MFFSSSRGTTLQLFPSRSIEIEPAPSNVRAWLRVVMISGMAALVLLLGSGRPSSVVAQDPTCTGDATCPRGVGGQDPICHLRADPGCGGCSSTIVVGNSRCCYTVTSPIIIDLEGSGFHLTDAAHGVTSPILLEYKQLFQVSWTAPGSTDAWLVLDRNGDGTINDFSEMFGNLTPQPDPPPGQFKNGFLALAVYDRPELGGNGDGWITKQDAIFGKLRVWQDKNHDGISQADELFTLDSVGIAGISLAYRMSEKRDEFGNKFTYRSVIRDTDGSEVGKVIYDVFLLIKDK